MRTILCSTAAAALAAAMAIPAAAQSPLDAELNAEVVPVPLPVPLAATSQPPPAGAERVVVETTGPGTPAAGRAYDPERGTYAVFDRQTSTWRIFDARTDALIDEVVTAAPPAPAAPQVGMTTDTFERGVGQVGQAGAAPAATAPVPGTVPGGAEERYYDVERGSYAVHLPVKSQWQIFDAETGQPMEVLNDGEFDPHEPGYTVVFPGNPGVEVGMGTAPGAGRGGGDLVEIIESR